MPIESSSLSPLATLAEINERDAWADQLLVAAALPNLKRMVRWRSVGADGLAFSVPVVPMTLFNRVVGLGATQAGQCSDIQHLDRFFADGPRGRWAVQPAPGEHEAGLQELLSDAGYTLLPQRMAKMARDLVAHPQADPLHPAGLEIQRVGADAAAEFATPSSKAWGCRPGTANGCAGCPGRPGWHCYAVRRDGKAVAAAAMFVREGRAWLGMATTLPQHRGLGAQRLLMLQRLADATRSGCRFASTETGALQPGEVHPSYNNMLACGLQRIATRLNWAGPAKRPRARRRNLGFRR